MWSIDSKKGLGFSTLGCNSRINGTVWNESTVFGRISPTRRHILVGMKGKRTSLCQTSGGRIHPKQVQFILQRFYMIWWLPAFDPTITFIFQKIKGCMRFKNRGKKNIIMSDKWMVYSSIQERQLVKNLMKWWFVWWPCVRSTLGRLILISVQHTLGLLTIVGWCHISKIALEHLMVLIYQWHRPTDELIRYIGRSGKPTQNVLAIVDFDMRFMYAPIARIYAWH